ncbi:MAG TPA: hypothetical protein VGV87_01270 [Blastocatellia bacterium]|nr:hypothetical protein [Blastocatellia bacterium]
MKQQAVILLVVLAPIICCRQPQSTANLQTASTGNLQNSVTPLVFDGRAGGCAFFFVYKDTQDKTKVITVYGSEKELRITTGPKTFEIGKTPSLKVQLDDYGQAQHGEYCSDVVGNGEPIPQHIEATSGRVTVFITQKAGKEVPSAAYRITVKLKNVNFLIANGGSFYVESVEMSNVLVGWICC